MRLPLFMVLAAFAAQLPAQCSNVWIAEDAVPGVFGQPYVGYEWDPDGAGPARSQIVVVGNWMPAAGSTLTSSIAAFDRVTQRWSSLASGLNWYVGALTTLSSGELVAGGGFTFAGTMSVP